MSKSTRYALVGTGGRAPMYIDPLATRFRDAGELVALCDPNPARLEYHNARLANELGYHRVPAYHSDDFDRMVRETRADCVIVTTVDALHHKYIIRAMELGCDVVTEKPMTIDAEKCRAILDATSRTGRKLRVAFNYRWTPSAALVRQVLSEGAIGDLIHVDMEYLLNTSHGADYFRRWHREKENSGGLLVHKATHHFDMVNWWIDAVPETVFAMGRLAFYGRRNAELRGEAVRYDRYTGHDAGGDPFALDLAGDKLMRGLYLEAERHDGYMRDRNVFGDNITIEDTMSVLVRYRTGVVLNYSLNAYLPREGFGIVFNGTKGRIEYREEHGSHVVAVRGEPAPQDEVRWETGLVVHPMFGRAYRVPVPRAQGGHMGGDSLLQAQVFARDAPRDPLGRDAGPGQGAASVLVGIAANRSMETGAAVNVRELCPELGDARRLSELN